jgi:hypothetical protein
MGHSVMGRFLMGCFGCESSKLYTQPIRSDNGIMCVAQSFKMRTGFIKQNRNFKTSPELKGQSDKFKH